MSELYPITLAYAESLRVARLELAASYFKGILIDSR